MGKENVAEVKDFVFAKVRGHPAWPARIIAVLDPRPASLKYTVYFYGTAETATVQEKDVFLYEENKERFGKPMKRKFFNEGIEELERDLKKVMESGTLGTNVVKGPKLSDIENTDQAVTNSEVKDTVEPVAETENKSVKRSRGSGDGELLPAKRKKVNPAENSKNDSGKDKKEPGEEKEGRKKRKSTVTEPTDLTSEGEKKTTGATEGARKKRKSTASVEDPSVRSSTEDKEKIASARNSDTLKRKRRKSSVSETQDTPTSKEQISRSGRVIKPKKFLYDEENKEDGESVKPKPKILPTESNQTGVDTSPKKAKKLSSKAQKEDSPTSGKPKTESQSPPKLSALGRVIWARSKCGQLVQVKVDHEKPSSFKNEKARLQWEKAYEQQLEKVKKKIEAGMELPDDVPVQLRPSTETNMSDEEIESRKKLRLIERKRGKVRWLKLETRLVDIDVLLKTSLQKTEVDTNRALELMDELIHLPLDPLMLKKHPQLVETVQKIRHYTGNVQSWNLSAEEESKFQKNALKIRQKANILLNKYRGLFAVSKPDEFWNVFLGSVNEFKSLTKNLTPDRVYSLIIDPSSPYYKEIAEFDNEEEDMGKEILKKFPKNSEEEKEEAEH